MSEPEILLPVTCPHCGKRWMSEFRATVVVEALQTRQIRLYATCQVSSWDASEAELTHIRASTMTGTQAGRRSTCS
jgi:hypothetical protein